MEPETRRWLAMGALECFTCLLEHQRPDEGPRIDQLASMARLITEAVKDAHPARRCAPIPTND